jgi:hypothetical protein
MALAQTTNMKPHLAIDRLGFMRRLLSFIDFFSHQLHNHFNKIIFFDSTYRSVVKR